MMFPRERGHALPKLMPLINAAGDSTTALPDLHRYGDKIMGSAITSLFGMNQNMPSMQYEPVPEREETEGADTRDAERRKLRARSGGVRSTLLSNPLGQNGMGINPQGLLGKVQS